jgi:hypothetical protein
MWMMAFRNGTARLYIFEFSYFQNFLNVKEFSVIAAGFLPLAISADDPNELGGNSEENTSSFPTQNDV